jgi:very-short-patch-repair endonuclease
MKLVDLNEVEYKLNLQHYLADDRPRSKYHLQARELLKELYPMYMVLEEVPLRTYKGEYDVFLDFLIPQIKLSVEVQGEQHFKQNMHFHKNKLDFLRQVKRDKQKRNILELNNIKLIELNFNESVDEWRNKIQQKNDS